MFAKLSIFTPSLNIILPGVWKNSCWRCFEVSKEIFFNTAEEFYHFTPILNNFVFEEEQFLLLELYSVFHRFRQAKFEVGGLILNSSQFLPMLQLPQKMKLGLKVVKMESN